MITFIPQSPFQTTITSIRKDRSIFSGIVDINEKRHALCKNAQRPAFCFLYWTTYHFRKGIAILYVCKIIAQIHSFVNPLPQKIHKIYITKSRFCQGFRGFAGRPFVQNALIYKYAQRIIVLLIKTYFEHQELHKPIYTAKMIRRRKHSPQKPNVVPLRQRASIRIRQTKRDNRA